MAVASVPNAFVNGTNADALAVNANFTALVDFINQQCIQKDGSLAFTQIPTGPNANPTTDNQFTRKRYVDDTVANAVPQSAYKELHLVRSTDQSATPGPGWTNIIWNSTVTNVSGWTVDGAGVVTVNPNPGLYAVMLGVVASAPATVWSAELRSTAWSALPILDSENASGATALQVGGVVLLQAGDTLQAWVRNNDTTNAFNFQARLWMVRLAD